MAAQSEPLYRLLERTVAIHAALTEAQYLQIHRLLAEPPDGSRSGRTAHLFDLADAPEPDRVLAYLREQQLPHTVAEERRWSPKPGR
jgi:hypothetical protein